jgi:vacuolar-type H+-ATPase subunit E/Vma4
MKKQTASQKRYARLKKLIAACLERFSEDEMLEVFSKETGNDYIERKEIDEMISELEMEGYFILKTQSLAEQIKAEAFLQELTVNPYQLKLIA